MPGSFSQNDEIIELAYSEGARDYKWRGWHFDRMLPNVSHFRFSFWIKFQTPIPPLSHNFGIKIQGELHNDWIKKCVKDEWFFVDISDK